MFRSLRSYFGGLLALCCLALSLPYAAPLFAATSLVPSGAEWKYLDDGSDQGTAWRALGFPDASWAAGNAQLGYGDGDEVTEVSYGPNSSDKYITTYFRRTFSVSNPALYDSLELRLLRDDGAVVYINGLEVMRSNMPDGSIGFETEAGGNTGSENAFYTETLDPSGASKRQATRSQSKSIRDHQAAQTSALISNYLPSQRARSK